MKRYVLAIDPSGNYSEGKGTTGWCLYDITTKKIAKYGAIKASHYDNIYDYWYAHIELIDGLSGYTFHLVIEDYLLYANKATAQINSRFETPRLIGVIEFEAYRRGIEINKQTASAVKERWNDQILVRKGLLREENKHYYMPNPNDTTILVDHIRDAIRHAVHFATFYKKGKI